MADYDLLVLGGGTAGLTMALRTAAAGWRVALCEGALYGSELGGTCINTGCIPTHALIEAAQVRHSVLGAGRFGTNVQNVSLDYDVAKRRTDELVLRHRTERYQAAEQSGFSLVRGQAVFVGERTVAVGDDQFTAERIVVATGARPLIPPLEGLEEVGYLTSTTALGLTTLPASLIIMGGGPVAVQFAQMYARFGVAVTMLQRSGRLLPGVEPELAAELTRILLQEGIGVHLGTAVRRVEATAGGVRVTAEADQEVAFNAERLFLAVGRRPNTDGLGLESAGVATDPRGFIAANSAFQTSAPGVWAIGDCTGGAMFTNRAWHDAILLSRSLLFGGQISVEGQLVPYAISTDPEVGVAGLGEEEAHSQGRSIRISYWPFSAVARAQMMGREEGFIKLISETGTGRLLGAHLIGPSVGELIHELALGIRLGATLFDLQDLIHIHPTLAEGINAAAQT